MRMLTTEPIHPLLGTAPTVIAPMFGRVAGQHRLEDDRPTTDRAPSRRPMLAPLPGHR